MNHVFHEVWNALARHLDVDPLAIESTQDLEHDWGLDGLDLILLVIRLEDVLDIELLLPSLDRVRTVGELASVVCCFARAREEDTLTDASRSGVQPGSAAPLRERIRRGVHRARKNRVHRDLRRAARGADRTARTCRRDDVRE